GEWLIPPTRPLRAVYRRTGSGFFAVARFDLSGMWLSGDPSRFVRGNVPASLVVTDRMREAIRPDVQPIGEGPAVTVVSPHATVLWRPMGGSQWVEVPRPSAPLSLIVERPARLPATGDRPAMDVDAAYLIEFDLFFRTE